MKYKNKKNAKWLINCGKFYIKFDIKYICFHQFVQLHFLDKSIEIHLFGIKNCCHKIKHPVTQPICDIMGFLMGSLNLRLALKGCSEFSDPLLSMNIWNRTNIIRKA